VSKPARTNWKAKYWELHKKHMELEQAFIELARDLHVAETLYRKSVEKKKK